MKFTHPAWRKNKYPVSHSRRRSTIPCTRSEFDCSTNTALGEVSDESARLCWALKSAARARSASLGRSKLAARGSPRARFDIAAALELSARASVSIARIGRSRPLGSPERWNRSLAPARPRSVDRIGRSSPRGLARSLDRTEPNENEPNQPSQGYPETLRGARPLMPVALNTETKILHVGNALHGYALI